MKLIALKSPKVCVGNDINAIINTSIPTLKDNDILAIASKIVSLCEGAVAEKHTTHKEALIQEEAESYVLPSPTAPHPFYLTIKHHMLIPSAGIDESNADNNDAYILYPRDPFASATRIWNFLKERDGLDNLGVIITDSHTTPLRRGVTGISLAWCGFEALKNYVGAKDCFGHTLRFTQRNNVDALAASAVFIMGEGSEQTPFCLMNDFNDIMFCKNPPSDTDKEAFLIPMQEDLYGPILSYAPWKKGAKAIDDHSL